MLKTPTYKDLVCSKRNGGKHTLWHAKMSHEALEALMANGASGRLFWQARSMCGAGATADNAIADFQKQWRWLMKHPQATLGHLV